MYLQEKVRDSSSESIQVALIVDAMAIRKQIVWDAQTSSFVGYTDFGCGMQADATDEASEALVFMVNGIFGNWKQPIGYFLTNGVSGNTLAELLTQTLIRLHEIGIDVITLTLDGHQANQAAVKKLGANLKSNLSSSFPHPANEDAMIYVFFDACHMLKLIRNTLCVCGEYCIIVQVHLPQIPVSCKRPPEVLV